MWKLRICQNKLIKSLVDSQTEFILINEYYVLFNIRAGVGAAERFISDKTRIASILNSFKKDLLYPSCQFVCERIFNIDFV